MRRFAQRLLQLLRLRRSDDDLARELRAHTALLTDAYEARGLSPDDAGRAARLALGNPALIRDAHRDARSFRWIEDVRQDAAHGLRLLWRSPVFTVTALLSLAIGIGANTAIFTVANGLLLRPPSGIVDPSALIDIGARRGDGGLNPLNYTTYREVTDRATSLTAVLGEDLFPHVMGLLPPGGANAEPVLGQSVTTTFFSTLGVQPSRGRLFVDGEEPAAVLAYDYWRARFGGSEAVIGQVVRLNGRTISVVGVAAPEFQGTGMQKADLWLSMPSDATSGGLVIRGRLRPDASIESAMAELQVLRETTVRDPGATPDREHQLTALPYSRAGGNRNVVLGFSLVLMVLVSFVLAAACANVAGIMLTRATARAREMSLRAALGAGRGRLIRQLLTETLVLFLLSGILGIGLARLLIALAMTILPPLPTSLVIPLTLDWRVLSFAASLSVLAAVAFGVWPAFRGSRVDAGASLKDAARSSSGHAVARRLFVVGQIVCGVMLVTLSALFVRVLLYAGGGAAPGFDTRNVDVATVNVSVLGESKGDAAVLWRRIIDATRQGPNVERASLARVPPGGFEGIGLGGIAPADRPGATEMLSPAWNIVDTEYFTTLGIPLLAGRDFVATDTGGAPRVVVISDTLARRFWPGQPAVGQSVRLAIFNARARRDEIVSATVVGVAGDIRSTSLIDGLAEPYVYLPLSQSDAIGATDMTTTMSIVARRGSGDTLTATMATTVQSIDPRLILSNAQPLAAAVALGLTPQRVLAAIAGTLGLVALLLASMGVYGVTAYAVTLRRREFAIRLALGESRGRIVRMVFRQCAWLLVIGLVIGLMLSVGVGQVLAGFLYGLPAVHVPTLAGTAVLFLLIGAAAAVAPATQAIRAGWPRALRED